MQTNEKKRFQIDPYNKPLHRPGVYLIRNLLNGKQYVGLSKDVANRLKDHACGHGCSPVLAKAIRKYGAVSFFAMPVFYSLDGTDCLLEVETSLIAEYNCISHGYNVQAASQSYGPYGAAHSAAVKAAHARPGAKERRMLAASLRESNPEFLAARAEWMKTLNGDPEIAVRRLENLRAAAKLPSRRESSSRASKLRFADSNAESKFREGWLKYRNSPDYQERTSDEAKRRMSDPEYKESLHAKMRATMATDEFKAKRSVASIAMHTPEVRAKKSAKAKANWEAPGFKDAFREARKGFRWITDGSVNKHFRGDGEPPEGWRIGRSGIDNRPKQD
jgi:group I intron endonuclease